MEESRSDSRANSNRRRVLTGLGILSLFSFLKIVGFQKKRETIACAPPPDKKETKKLLTQDGQLVEVDISKIKQLKQKITDQELREWIRKK
jgi:hypothetical protein